MRKNVSPKIIFVVFLLLFASSYSVIYSSFNCPLTNTEISDNNCLGIESSDTTSSWSWDAYLKGTAKYTLNEGTSFLLFGNDNSDNYRSSIEIMGVEGADKTLVGRYQSQGSYYVLNLRSKFKNGGDDLTLSRIYPNGTRRILQRVYYPNTLNTWYKLSLEFNDANIKAGVNDQNLINYEGVGQYEYPPKTGKTGPLIWGGNYDTTYQPSTTNYYKNFTFEDHLIKDIYVFIPGLAASINANSIFNCSENSTGWVLAPYAKPIYDKFANAMLQQPGIQLNDNFFVYTYDWRKEMSSQSVDFYKYLENIKKQNMNIKLNLIGHSMGGLIIKGFLNDYPNYQVSKTLTVGTPHLGSPLAYSMWENGELIHDDPLMQLAFKTLLITCKISNPSLTNREIVQSKVPSIKDLLPITPYLQINNSMINIENMYYQNDWLKKVNIEDINNKLITIGGNGIKTLVGIIVSKSEDFKTWPDGKPESLITSSEGDGTVPLSSALATSSKQNIVNSVEHSELVSNDESLKVILTKLNLNPTIVANTTPQSSLINTVKNFWTQKSKINWKRYKVK